jgi:hypothetical protein
MFPIVIVSPFFTKLMSVFIDVYAITLFPFIVSKEKMDETTLNHEKIHIEQQKELLVVFFYLLYAYYFIENYYFYRDTHTAYMMIPFEREAYEYDGDLSYLSKRKRYRWLHFR